MNIQTITPHELSVKQQNGHPIELLDVRTPIEYREVHCPFSRNFPLSNLDPKAIINSRDRSDNNPIYIICRSGNRGQQACEQFQAAGFSNAINVAGGTLAWIESGLPVNRGKKAISLERQVRIAAGSLVLVGVILSILIDPYCIGLSAFIGAGLVFSGITDTCGMGLVLARMPWNTIANHQQCSSMAMTTSTSAKSPSENR